MLVTLCGCDPTLQPWHTQKLTAEFTADRLDEINSFNRYLELEDRLFKQLENEVYSRVGTGQDLTLVRYSSGSASDALKNLPNWNRTLELKTAQPVGGALLLHGMSDSPYSLRKLAETLHRANYWVIVLRLPGHGTAPSGLRFVRWEDMAAAVKLAAAHLKSAVGKKPIHLVGYSTGAGLALNYTLDSLSTMSVPTPASLILISPAIGVHPAARYARVKTWLSVIPGLHHLAWLSIEPEFDPYKYNSFAANAGTQVYRLTRSVAGRIAHYAQAPNGKPFPPILVFKSTVDATVSNQAVLDDLLVPLGDNGNALVLFDINRFAAKSTFMVTNPGTFTNQLTNDEKLPASLTLLTNETSESRRVHLRRRPPFSTRFTEITPLDLQWPADVISLSHVALPFPPDDPLYGIHPPADGDRLFLGQLALRGERGLLKISSDWVLRLRYNPFYDYLENRSMNWLADHNGN